MARRHGSGRPRPDGAVNTGTSCNKQWHHFEPLTSSAARRTKWEYPWFAAGSRLPLHCLWPTSTPQQFAQDQLLLMVSERYQHPKRAIAAMSGPLTTWNPLIRVWRCVARLRSPNSGGRTDRAFLEVMFQKLAINFAGGRIRKDASAAISFLAVYLILTNTACLTV
jgi:hypothetical protein